MGDSAMDNGSVDPHLTTKIVSSYLKHHTVAADQVSELITSVHQALGRLGRPIQPEEVRTPAVPVRRSVHHDYVVCLDCGYRGKTLRRHIATRHGLTRDDYLMRWGLKRDHRLTAPAYTEQRSMLAKERGLGRKPSTQVATPAPTAAVLANAASNSEAKPARKRSTRAASKSADGTAAAPSARRLTP